MNIKELRRELVSWGRFWRNHESSIGFSRTSTCSILMEAAKTGIWASSNFQRSPGRASEQINSPRWIDALDEIIDQLPQQQKRVLTLKYIKKQSLNTTEKIAAINAEMELLRISLS